MAGRLSARSRTILVLVGVLSVAALGFVLGGMVLGGTNAYYRGVDEATVGAPEAYDRYGSGATGSGDQLSSEDKGVTGPSGQAPTADVDAMVIRNNSLDLRVDEIEKAIESIRSVAKKHGAAITDMSVSGGVDPGPRPLVEDSPAYPSPASASLVLRVDAAKLDALESDVAKLGRVVTQTGTSGDVTQEYVDLSARLKNLQATEARLRGFTTKATKISDLLQIEAELSRVRGEIEAMQAQVQYLERQTAKATLNVSLTEPGPLVQPSGDDWGFSDAIRRGIQSAAALVMGLITVVIAVLPVVIVVAIAWAIFVAVRRRRARRLEPDRD